MERRTSLRREPFQEVEEPSHNGRRSRGFCHPGPTRHRHSLETSTLLESCDEEGSPFELVPASASSAACLAAGWRKRHVFGLRCSDRILQHDSDARAQPDGLLLLSRRGLPPRFVHHRRSACAHRDSVESRAFCVTASTNPHEFIVPARCLTGARSSSVLAL